MHDTCLVLLALVVLLHKKEGRDSIIVKKQAAHCIVHTIKPVPFDNTFSGCIVQRVHSSTMRLIMSNTEGNERSNIVVFLCANFFISCLVIETGRSQGSWPCSNHTFFVHATIQERTDHCIIVWNFDANAP